MLKPLPRSDGFTLIELMIIVVIIGVLIAIGVPKYMSMVTKSKEGATLGNLANLRSALSVYYGDNEQNYPSDDLSSLTVDSRYLPIMPILKTPGHHEDASGVTAEVSPSDTGLWSYNNDMDDMRWGGVRVGCLHNDRLGIVWTNY